MKKTKTIKIQSPREIELGKTLELKGKTFEVIDNTKVFEVTLKEIIYKQYE